MMTRDYGLETKFCRLGEDIAVTDGGHVVGMLWRRRVLSAISGGASDTSVAAVMDTDIVSVDVNDSVCDGQQKMRETGRWAVRVIEDGYYRGIFTTDRFIHVYRYVNGQQRSTQMFELAANRLGDVRASLMRQNRAWGRRFRA